jgi:hypothetical protein
LLWRMAVILKANKVDLFVSSVLLVFWYHSPCTVTHLSHDRTFTLHRHRLVTWSHIHLAI